MRRKFVSVGAVTAMYVVGAGLLYDTFWSGPGTSVVMLCTSPASPRFTAAAARMEVAARNGGTPPSRFRVRQTNLLYDLLWPRWFRGHGAAYVWGQGLVVVDARWSAGLTDAEMDCVLAHEIGHILQYDSGRPMARPTMELDADNRAARLCGPDNWYLFFERHIGARLAE